MVNLLFGCNVMVPEDLGEHACEHVDVPGTEITAALTAEDDASAVIEASGEPYTVTLPASGSGFVRVVLLEEADVVLFVGEQSVVGSLSECDCEEPLPEPTPDGFCPDDIPEHYHLHLDPGYWHLELSSDDVDSVWLMLAPLTTPHVHED
jgi:hypothetical protein